MWPCTEVPPGIGQLVAAPLHLTAAVMMMSENEKIHEHGLFLECLCSSLPALWHLPGRVISDAQDPRPALSIPLQSSFVSLLACSSFRKCFCNSLGNYKCNLET